MRVLFICKSVFRSTIFCALIFLVWTVFRGFHIATFSLAMSVFQTFLRAQQPASSEMAPPALDLLKLSASELQSLMHKGELTSLQLVRLCLAQIQRNDRAGHNLRAIISLPSTEVIEAEAKTLDQERSQGKIRGPFHGLPIIVKVLLMQFV